MEKIIITCPNDLETMNLKYDQLVFANCVKCGDEFSFKFRKDRISRQKLLLCRKCLSKKTLTEHYGSVENARKEIELKRLQTAKDKYGVDCKVYMYRNDLNGGTGSFKDVSGSLAASAMKEQDADINERAHDTMEQKYGVRYYSQTDQYNEQVAQTALENWGVDHHLKAEEVKERIKQTCLEKYGTENPMQNPEVLKKSQETCLLKFGDTSVFGKNSSKYNEIQQHIQDKYGVKNVAQNEDVKRKIKETFLQKYNVDNKIFNEFKKEYRKCFQRTRSKDKKNQLLNNEEFHCVFCSNL